MSRKVYSHTPCTLDITTLNKHVAHSQLSVQFMQETNPPLQNTRCHAVTSHNTTSFTFTKELQMWHTLRVILGKSNSSCNNVPPHPYPQILSQCLHQFAGITSPYGIFLIHQLDTSNMPSSNEGINLPSNTISVYYIPFSGNMFRPSTVTDSCLQLDWQLHFLCLSSCCADCNKEGMFPEEST